MFASRQGYLDTVQTLIDSGADVNEVDPGDHTSALLIATINGTSMSPWLCSIMARIPNLAETNGVTPLYGVLNCIWAAKTEYPQPEAQTQQKTSYLDLMRALLDRGANPNARLKMKVWYSGYNRDMSGLDETGATPFWRAAYADDVQAMKLLVAHGADPSLATEKLAAGGRFYQEATSKDSLGTAAGAGGRTEHLAVGRGVGRVLRVELHGIRAPVRADGHADGGSVPRGGAARERQRPGRRRQHPAAQCRSSR